MAVTMKPRIVLVDAYRGIAMREFVCLCPVMEIFRNAVVYIICAMTNII